MERMTKFSIRNPAQDFTPLDRGGYKAYGVLNKFGDTPRANAIMKNMGITPEARAAALQAYKEIGK